MRYAWTTPASAPYLAGPTSARLAEADRAVAALRGDAERWSRWWLGTGAFVAAVVGLFVSAGVVGAIVDLGRAAALDVVVVLLALALALAGLAVLVRLARSGRRITRAAAAWLRAPYVAGLRSPDAAGWVRARTVNLEPRVLARLVTATFALLVGVAGVALAARDLVQGATALSGAAAAIGVLGLVCGCGQVAGVLRIVAALGAADPLRVRLRGRR
ncbi:uncharacterized membrane protein YhaH (DUF805 family) [Nocardioides zeae]|uniref:Uncharacterized membrane protein YhaH (DUF805 family) n=1 Tax=Nocardioides zeae TaxID=1457234 RepID=A0ACC6IIE9_9ACTN|nr:hypothetical protein [Nocardioides zeae]MDR6176116.1 uncharacterized membrane protein YhaH (DUF805 family) [Nocardioides zeae]MDR6210262.1 uncharacterized membrane protein YhaH (DUF805 family) [Nocardioides zeae]